MANSGSSDMDDESIAPVSDLRSKFENLAKTKTAPPAPPGAPSHAHIAKATTLPVPPAPDRGRASLDIPRSQPWPSTEQSGQGLFFKREEVSKASQLAELRPAATSRQRPVSMNLSPLPSPYRLPTLNIESPISTSPPDSGTYNKLSLPLRNPQATNDTADALARSPLQKKPAPPLPPSISKEKQAENAFTGRGQVPSDLPSPGLKKQPPPINRLNKPNTPIALAPLNLDVKKEFPGSLSPFTTPPSSDESPTQYSIPSIRQRKDVDRSAKPGNFTSPHSHHAVEARRGSSAPAARPSQMTKDRQVSVPAVLHGGPSDRPEDRPQLPARTQKESSPARTSRALVPDAPTDSRRRVPSPRPPRPLESSKAPRNNMEFLPPPTRAPASRDGAPPGNKPLSTVKASVAARSIADSATESSSRASSAQGYYSDQEIHATEKSASSYGYPDATRTNRRPPRAPGTNQIYLSSDSRQLDICGRYCCTTGHFARVYDTTTGRPVFELSNPEKEFKITAVVFKPGVSAEQDGQVIWFGNNYGEIKEIDVAQKQIIRTKSNAHNAREIVKMYRFRNSIWSIDEDGRLHVWDPDDSGTPSLQRLPHVYRVSRGHTFSMIVGHYLWFAAGKEIRIYDPMGGEQNFHVTIHALSQPSAGEVTSGAVISSQIGRAYFGHSDGKVSIYSSTDFSCIGLVTASSYKINCLAGVGDFLWAGLGTGRMYVYDTRQNPWVVRKDWLGHIEPVCGMVVDKSTMWKSGHAIVASLGLDKTICLWDGWLEVDRIEMDMQEHDVEYCSFREIKAVVITWNAGASTPGTLRAEDRDSNFFRKAMQTDDPPDLLVFGFQELVDLEDKKLTAKTLFKGTKRKDSSHHDQMSRQYRAWRDYLARVIEDYMPASEPYTLLHTANLVGLFSCVFVKSNQRSQIRDVQVAEVKRGLGGLHGNKGALILRFILDDSSLCFANCHLAAGQSHTTNRNEDITAVLEASSLPKQTNLDKRVDHFIGGGDGSMVMDHEIAVVNGDLNYRIDTMGRDTVIKAIRDGNLSKLLDRDQLLLSYRRNPAFRLRAFTELPITFAPTYKYDLGSDTYDTSEKSRSPAWCDRILFRGIGRIRQLEYRRHEGFRMSDHRPVSGTFLMRIKRIDHNKRVRSWDACERRLIAEKQRLAADERLDYLISVLGVEIKEARRLIDT